MADLGKRIRAARGYAGGLSRDDLADLIETSPTMIKRIEVEQRSLQSYEIRGMTERIADVCGLPAEFFTADLAQLEPGWQPPEDQLQRLEDGAKQVLDILEQQSAKRDLQIQANEEVFARLDADVQRLTQRLDELADQASEQLTVGSQRLDAFAAILDEAGKRAT